MLEQYDSAIIDNQIGSDVVTAAQNRDEDVLAQKTALLEQRTAVLKQKKQALDDIDAQISVTGATVVDTKAEEEQLEAANVALQAAKDSLNSYNELDTRIFSPRHRHRLMRASAGSLFFRQLRLQVTEISLAIRQLLRQM